MKKKKSYYKEKTVFTPRNTNLTDRYRKVLDTFSRHEFSRILDCGCGSGDFSILLKKACNAKEIYGLEVSDEGVELSKRKGIEAFKVDLDNEEFPFEENYFDAVFAGEVIEHLFDTDHFLDEVYKALKRGGIFVITTPNLAWIYSRFALLSGYLPFKYGVSFMHPEVGHMKMTSSCDIMNPEHIRLFTFSALINLLRLHGFHVIDVKGCHSTESYADTLLLKVAKLLDKIFALKPSWSCGVIVVSTKRCEK